MEMEQKFHTTMFGGFRKSDVLTYIDSSARIHAQDLEELKTELERLREENRQATARAEAAESRLNELGPRATQSDQAMGELEAKRAALETAERELQELRAQLAAAQPKAEAYDAVKDLTAGIELEAHKRAKQIREEADRNARQVRARTEQWAGKVRSSYERLRTDVEATVIHAADELERAGRALAASTQEFKEHDGALKKLMEQSKQAAEEK